MDNHNLDGLDDVFARTIELTSAYISNSTNSLSPAEFQDLTRETFVTLSNLHAGNSIPVEKPEDYSKSKAEIKRSIGVESLISFIDGKPYKSLKRHLGSNGYTPETYKETFGLPADYPLTHPAYSARRSELAKSIGLGQKGRQPKTSTAKRPKAARG